MKLIARQIERVTNANQGISLCAVVFIFCLYLAFTIGIFSFYHYSALNFFIFDLLGMHINPPMWLYYISSLLAFLVFGHICFNLFSKKYRLLPIFIYAISPWIHYLTAANSFYIFILLFLILGMWGFTFARKGRSMLGLTLLFISSLLLGASSLLMLLTIPFIYLSVVKSKLLKKSDVRTWGKLLILLYLGILTATMFHQVGFTNITKSQVTIFSNPGLMGEINRLQGDTKKYNSIVAARIFENKYIYLIKYSAYKMLEHFSPSNYFSIQLRLLGFSFTPPLFIGFFLPLIYGLIQISKSKIIQPILILFLALTIPSLMHQQLVDLNSLVIVAPVLILLITYGLIKLLETKHKRRNLILGVSIFMVFFQLAYTIIDMSYRDRHRFNLIIGSDIYGGLGKQ